MMELIIEHNELDAALRRCGSTWNAGQTHGLLCSRLARDPLSEVIKDLLEITRATVDDEADDESSEYAYSDLMEYLRVAAQLMYEVLAEFRDPGGKMLRNESTTLH